MGGTTNTNEAKLPADATSAPTTPVYSHGASGSWEEAPWYDRALPPNIANAYVKAKNFLNKPFHIPEMELPVAAAKTTSPLPPVSSKAESFDDNIQEQQYLRHLRQGTEINWAGQPIERVTPNLKQGETVNIGKIPEKPLSPLPPDMFQQPEAAAYWYTKAGYPTAAKTALAIAGVRKGLTDSVKNLIDPANLAFLVGTEGLGEVVPIITDLINAGFTTYQIKTAIDTIPNVRTAIRNHDPETAAQLMTEGGIATAFGVVGTLHGIKEVKKTSKIKPANIDIVSNNSISFAKDSNGITWATDKSVSPNPVSIPDNIPANEREAYAADKLKQQGEMAAELKKRLLAIPGAIEVKSQATTAPVTESYHPDLQKEQRLADLKGEVSKTSHATLAPIPLSLKGDNPAITDESIHGHEYGHGAQAIINGAQLAELRSYMHPESIGKATAAAVTRWPSGGAKTYDEWLTKDPNNALNVIQNSLAGPLTQEVVYGIPMNENPGIAGDMRDTSHALHSLGLTLAQQEDVMDYLMRGWKDKLTAKNPLTGRTLGDIIKQYAPRDEDIRAELLASPNKIDKFAEEVRQHENEVRQYENRQRKGNNRGNVAGISEGTEQVGRKNVARTEGVSAKSNISKSLRAIPGAIQIKP